VAWQHDNDCIRCILLRDSYGRLRCSHVWTVHFHVSGGQALHYTCTTIWIRMPKHPAAYADRRMQFCACQFCTAAPCTTVEGFAKGHVRAEIIMISARNWIWIRPPPRISPCVFITAVRGRRIVEDMCYEIRRVVIQSEKFAPSQ
jgi:hypothetical protein